MDRKILYLQGGARGREYAVNKDVRRVLIEVGLLVLNRLLTWLSTLLEGGNPGDGKHVR